MRDIKFRGQRQSDNEWIYGDILQPTELCNIYEISDCESIDGSRYDVIKDTVGQYIGLKDKNGKEIYEGDIIEYKADGEIIYKGTVKYSEKYAQYVLVGTLTVKDEFEPLGEYNIEAFEVIGNIYDNSDLLKEENK